MANDSVSTKACQTPPRDYRFSRVEIHFSSSKSPRREPEPARVCPWYGRVPYLQTTATNATMN